MSPPRHWYQRLGIAAQARLAHPLTWGRVQRFRGRIGETGAAGLSRPIFVNSHRRSGTHLLIDSIRANFAVVDDWFHLEEDIFQALATAPVVVKDHEFRRGDKIASSQVWSSYLHWVSASLCYSLGRHIYIVRNPRDTLKSQFYFDLEGIEPAFRLTRTASFADYLRMPSARAPGAGLNQVAYWCGHVASWIGHRDLLVLRYEDLTADREATLDRISAFLELPRIPERLVDRSGVGTEATPTASSRVAAAWSVEDEALLLAEVAAAGLPDLGYGWGSIRQLPVTQAR
jgi:hypothetical protein